MSKSFRGFATLPFGKVAVIALTACPHLVIAALEVPDLVDSSVHTLPVQGIQCMSSKHPQKTTAVALNLKRLLRSGGVYADCKKLSRLSRVSGDHQNLPQTKSVPSSLVLRLAYVFDRLLGLILD